MLEKDPGARLLPPGADRSERSVGKRSGAPDGMVLPLKDLRNLVVVGPPVLRRDAAVADDVREGARAVRLLPHRVKDKPGLSGAGRPPSSLSGRGCGWGRGETGGRIVAGGMVTVDQLLLPPGDANHSCDDGEDDDEDSNGCGCQDDDRIPVGDETLVDNDLSFTFSSFCVRVFILSFRVFIFIVIVVAI